MKNYTEHAITSEDEIDLRKLFIIIKKRKKIIYSIVLVSTILSIVVAYFIKKPIYSIKAMVEIATINNNNNNNNNKSDSNSKEIVEKLIYKYKVKARGAKRELPYLNSIKIPRESKNILLLEVYARDNQDGKKYIQKVVDDITLTTNKNIDIYKENVKKQIEILKNDIKNNKRNFNNIENTTREMNKKLNSLSKFDPALSAIYTLQINEKNSNLLKIKNRISDTESKIAEYKNSISFENIKLTKIVDKIQLLDHPIKPKKSLIVVISFITSLIFSIFLVFFLNFVETLKREDD